MVDRNPHIFPGAPHVVILGAGASKAAFPNGDANGKVVPLMNELIPLLGLDRILKKYNIKFENTNIEDIYSDLILQNNNTELVEYLNQVIYEYFEEMKLPDAPTLYDYLLLSLRSKDIIATFNWDPFLGQAYQRNRDIKNLPQVAFLHGNVFVGICTDDKKFGFVNCKCSVCNNFFSPVGLLYPVKEKNYTQNPFINEQWKIIQHYLKNAYIFTIFGYGAPDTDVEAVSLLKNAWTKNQLIEQYEVEIVNIDSYDKLEKKWSPFIFKEHCSILSSIKDSELWLYPRRTCEAFAASHLMNRPWQFNRFPDLIKLSDLHQWIKPLVDEEAAGDNFNGEPCPSL